MRCFYHNDVEAVGTCSKCGKAACRQCIEDVGGALLCNNCMQSRIEPQRDRCCAGVHRMKWINKVPLLVLTLQMLFALPASAQNGTWTTKASMPTARYSLGVGV